MGGLTVLAELGEALPHHSFVYLGDTARLPYGTKSANTVLRYARQASRRLQAEGVGALVIACNTASAYAVTALRKELAPMPIFGVIEPGAAAVSSPPTSAPRVLVLATEATVREGAYARALLKRQPHARVYCRPAPMLVALAEAGEPEGPVADVLLQDVLTVPALPALTHVLLGCTHFPLFTDHLRRRLPAGVSLVDSAATTAQVVAAELGGGGAATSTSIVERTRFLATDDVERFARLGARFLGAPIRSVELTDL